ncbi:DNA primase [Streptomyces sp. NPDC050619]|uniref:DNA primase n=1 Tax=Streptomyces sp. NPDC050619 TaxID=3157214 RepID=UPI00343C3F5A
MNRVGLGLAVGAGYVLGRTKKMKLAFAVGSLVAGKKMHLSPRALADLASQQLLKNPQFKEIGDQLREDVRGVGKAASGAMVERQMDALADRLHGRTAEVRDQLEGVVPDASRLGSDEEEREEDQEPQAEYEEDQEQQAEYEEDEEPREEYEEDEESQPEEEPEPRPEKTARKAPAERAAKKAPAKKATAKKAAAKKTAPAKKGAARKTAQRKTAGKKTAAARDTARGARARMPKGGGER